MTNTIATAECIQRSRLDEIGLGDPDFTIELIDIMLEDGAERVRQMRAALMADRPSELGRVAHALKGSALNIGALQLAALCAEIDNAVRIGGSTVAEDKIAEVESAFAQASAELSSIKRELSA